MERAGYQNQDKGGNIRTIGREAFETFGFASAALKLAHRWSTDLPMTNLSTWGGNPHDSEAFADNPHIFAPAQVLIAGAPHSRFGAAVIAPIHITKAPGPNPGDG